MRLEVKYMDGMQLFMNDKGEWELYDSTYDISIHCNSEMERERVMKVANFFSTVDDILKEMEEATIPFNDSFNSGVCTAMNILKKHRDSINNSNSTEKEYTDNTKSDTESEITSFDLEDLPF